MKIISITTVKNEADIIESFVRYHLNIVDQMIILNNGSTDDTNFILNQLINENLPLIIIDDKDKYFKPVQKMNFLLKKAILEYDADIVCPIDVDEFITTDSGNPRKFIEKINPLTYYKLKWRTYVPTENDNNNEKFIPKRMTYIRDENLEEFKVIMHRDLFTKFNVGLALGSHDVDFDRDKLGDKIKCKICDKLNMAHFPLRSKEQTVSKVLVSYPNLLCRVEVNPNFGFHRSHYSPMFLKIKKYGHVDDEDVIDFAKRYSTKGNEVDANEEIKVIYKPLNLDFCKNLDLKYDFNITPLSNVLEHYVYLAKEVNRFKKNERLTLEKLNLYNKKILDLMDENKQIKLKLDSFKKEPSSFDTSNSFNENNLLLDINHLNEIISLKQEEISILKHKLSKFDENHTGFNNVIDENEKTINELLSKNKSQEQVIRNLMDENEILKNRLKEN